MTVRDLYNPLHLIDTTDTVKYNYDNFYSILRAYFSCFHGY